MALLKTIAEDYKEFNLQIQNAIPARKIIQNLEETNSFLYDVKTR